MIEDRTTTDVIAHGVRRGYGILLTTGYPWAVFVDASMALAIEVGDRSLQHFTPSVWGRKED